MRNKLNVPVYRMKRKNKKNRSVLMAFCLFLLVASLGLILGTSLGFLLNKPITEGAQSLDSSRLTTQKELKNKTMTFLVCGLDESKMLTDIILYVSLDLQNKKASILQIPRDTFISKEISTGKINGVYNRDYKGGNINHLIKVINDSMKLPVDHYVTITIPGFKKIVDSMGGVQVTVPTKINQDGFIINKGNQTLNGRQSEILMRHRNSYALGDLDRVMVQRSFFVGLAQKLLSNKLDVVTKVFPSAYKEIMTDLSAADMMGLYGDIKGFTLENIKIFMTPGESYDWPAYYPNGNGNSVYTVHTEALAKLLNEEFRFHQAQVAASELGLMQLSDRFDYLDHAGKDFSELSGASLGSSKGVSQIS